MFQSLIVDLEKNNHMMKDVMSAGEQLMNMLDGEAKVQFSVKCKVMAIERIYQGDQKDKNACPQGLQ